MPGSITRRFWLAFVASAAFSFAQDLAAKMDEYLNAHVKLQRFMGSVLVAKDGKIVLEKGYGLANVELDVPNTPATKLRLGSITKEFTATAVLQLQEQGKLSVSDAACNYLENCPEAWKAITIHHLLSHTSGIPSYTNDSKFPKPEFMRVPMKPLDIVMLSKDKPLEFQPGEKWKYDNTGYVFLGYIIEKVSGESYADYVKKHIFGPLDMNDTGYDNTRSILKGRAAGYTHGGPTGYLNADYLDMTLPHAAGALYSTVQDMYRWDRALYTEKALTRKSLDAMFTPVKSDYGYGLMLAPMFKHKQIGHGGGINGFTTMFERFPDDNATVIVLSNVEGGSAVARGLTAMLFGEKYNMPVEHKQVAIDPKLLDRYTGVYGSGPMQTTVRNESGTLTIEPKGQAKAEAYPMSDTEFFLKVVDATITFIPGENGTAKELVLNQGGMKFTARRVN